MSDNPQSVANDKGTIAFVHPGVATTGTAWCTHFKYTMDAISNDDDPFITILKAVEGSAYALYHDNGTAVALAAKYQVQKDDTVADVVDGLVASAAIVANPDCLVTDGASGGGTSAQIEVNPASAGEGNSVMLVCFDRLPSSNKDDIFNQTRPRFLRGAAEVTSGTGWHGFDIDNAMVVVASTGTDYASVDLLGASIARLLAYAYTQWEWVNGSFNATTDEMTVMLEATKDGWQEQQDVTLHDTATLSTKTQYAEYEDGAGAYAVLGKRNGRRLKLSIENLHATVDARVNYGNAADVTSGSEWGEKVAASSFISFTQNAPDGAISVAAVNATRFIIMIGDAR